jgi:mono/diheme cytochrome c family protein
MEDAPDMPENENFYVIIKHGIRFTGMPGWGKNFSDDQIWKLTSFLSQIGKLPAPRGEHA